MDKVRKMIDEAVKELRHLRTYQKCPEAWLWATRLHALIDCYVAIGGKDEWRNQAGVLRKEL